ncbi:hypothetical protein JT358_14520 [Micrococcales bacterium 31B]|nr:hypothetical protein [Micrococcales bacterium 31B]
MRIYLPLDLNQLEALHADGRLSDDEGLVAYAVSDTLRRENPDIDEEDLEYEAQLDAAFASVVRADGEPVKPIVASADLVPAAIDFIGDTTAVEVIGEVTTQQIVAIHIGEHPESADDDSDVEPELLWYDATEMLTALEFARSRD